MTQKFFPFPGIGSKTFEKLKKLRIHNSLDLLYHFPHRYLDFSRQLPISRLTPNSSITITAKVIKFQNIYTPRGKNLQIATVADSSGSTNLVWFNQPYLASAIKTGLTYSFAGTVSIYKNRPCIFTPEYGQYHTKNIIAVYPETKGLSSRWFRKTIQTHLHLLTQNITDPLPPKFRSDHQLLDLKSALINIHHPSNQPTLQQARLRLAVNEILSLLIRAHLLKKHHQLQKPARPFKSYPLSSFIKSLPFRLTPSQKQSWSEIKKDLTSKEHLAHRLLVGDVGSGKTILAVLACHLAHLNHQSSLVLVPTNILAQQHSKNFKKFLPQTPIKLLTSKNKIKVFPKNPIIIATHAAIHHPSLPPISLLIIDEQHKFGVTQRSFLSRQSPPPHQITMTATPIPRTVSLTLLGHLDLSRLDPLPHHQPPKTFLVPNHKKNDCYQWLSQQIKTTRTQAFIVCPFIEESETLSSVKSAVKEFEHLSAKVFPNLKLGLIHGKTKNRDQIIQNFLDNKINILVTTPIIEVGIDIPNASTVIIQSADRFGLAQLHQLRGRVGRGSTESYCYLFTESDNDKALSRLNFLAKNSDGQKIADYDLATRGPGEAFSTLQHGFPSLKIADLSDLKLITFAQKILTDLITNYPSLDLTKLTKPISSSISPITN